MGSPILWQLIMNALFLGNFLGTLGLGGGAKEESFDIGAFSSSLYFLFISPLQRLKVYPHIQPKVRICFNFQQIRVCAGKDFYCDSVLCSEFLKTELRQDY